MQLNVDDTVSEKPPPATDIISEIDESILDDDKTPSSAVERERNDIIKVKKVCKCSYELVRSMLSKLTECINPSNHNFRSRLVLAGGEASGRARHEEGVGPRGVPRTHQPRGDGDRAGAAEGRHGGPREEAH